MSDAQRFLAVFFLILLPILCGLMLTAIWIEPLDGSLTRMGGYSERDFGWSGKQKTLDIEDISVPAYKEYADVLVIGDSFSKPGMWQGFLKQNTGLSTVNLDLIKTSLPDILQTPTFKKHPPRVVVVESLEVFFLINFRQPNPECDVTPNLPASPALDILPKQVPFREKERTNGISFANLNLNLKYAWAYLQKELFSYFFDQNNSPVSLIQLKRTDLFTNRLSDTLLYYRMDLDKSAWQDAVVDAALCQILSLQHQFQANQYTTFVFILVPDKLTAYTPFIANQDKLPHTDLTNKLIKRGIQTPNLYNELAAAIANGEKDIYLDNDTHFGSRGQEIMALTLQKFLLDLGAIKNKTANIDGE